MYKLEFLASARRDMEEAVEYIGVKLGNVHAADRLAEEMIKAAEKLRDMPYKCSVYISPRPLKHEYRKLLVNNYIMFYSVDEDQKLITVTRVIYAKRDLAKLLN